MDLMIKAQQFLAEEQELLADFVLDMNDAEGKEYAKAAGLWVTQIARVQGIKDTLEMLEIPVEEELDEYECECGEVIYYLEHEVKAMDVAEQQIDCRKCGKVYRI